MSDEVEIVTNEWKTFIRNTDEATRNLTRTIVIESSADIANEFYRVLMTDPQASNFLSNTQVETHLKGSLAQWLISVLSPTEESVTSLLETQKRVSIIHSRIGIPSQLVLRGSRVLKRKLYELIGEKTPDLRLQCTMMKFITYSIDIAMEIMNAFYSNNDFDAAKEDENYRVFSLLENAELEKEKQLANILDWDVEFIYQVVLNRSVYGLKLLSRSDFGLWFTHKGKHYFSGIADIGYISKLIDQTDEAIIAAKDANADNLNNLLISVRDNILQITSLLKNLFDEVSKQDVGRDVLTKLLNRRFLPTIFKREILIASKSSTNLAVVIVDIDYFKSINDKYGHNIGDEVLYQVSSILYDSVRANDFVFRYGGDEFLLLLTEIEEKEAITVTERIRKKVMSLTIETDKKEKVSVTITAGGAMFTGHPDYERLIKQADDALYQAKNTGRNRVNFNAANQ
ncbi:MAG: diguanylate cyclase [Enterobacteriaceae bacterium]|jgi:diguanylate cyclase|nr:diguanylate cyclase [Enterobacteriaceae bacterium]